MVRRSPLSIRLSSLALILAVGAVCCTDASLREKAPPPEKKADNLLRVKGEYCTERRTEVAFPVKVLYVLDQSFSLQFTDAKKKRYDALDESLDKLARQPNVEFAFVGFSSWARTSATKDRRFTGDKSEVSKFLQNPSNGLGTATDYQGALATALRFLEEDIQEAKPVERARTRYVVNFISDGVPAPRCKQGCEDDEEACMDGRDNDGDGKVDSSDSDCDDIGNNDKHPDNIYGICNIDESLDEVDGIEDDEYVEFEGACPAYNQPRQILSRVQDIMELEKNYNIGDVRMNTVFLFAPEDVVQSRLPNPQTQFALNREEASRMLKNMADTGEGTFRDVNLTASDDSFLEFEVTSVKADRTMTTMFARNDNAVATADGTIPDTDRDGLSDRYEREHDLDPEKSDTDGDGYTDLFEKVMADEGFDPGDEEVPAQSCGANDDKDGEGLLACEEAVLGTRPRQPDTDADGITDFLELIAGTEPTTPDAQDDVDFDGIKNLAEIRGGSDPLASDAESYRSSKIRYDIEELGLREFQTGRVERRCYRYDIREIPLTTTPIPRNRGLNRVLIRAGERPSQIAGISPEMRTACVEAFYNEGGIKKPADGVIELSREAIRRTRRSLQKVRSRLNGCSLLNGGSTGRGDVESMVERCMEPKITVGNRLYERETIFDMMQRHFDSDLNVRLPRRPFEFFEPLPTFQPDVHCFRPWEIDRLEAFMRKAARKCRQCAPGSGGGTDAGAAADTQP